MTLRKGAPSTLFIYPMETSELGEEQSALPPNLRL